MRAMRTSALFCLFLLGCGGGAASNPPPSTTSSPEAKAADTKPAEPTATAPTESKPAEMTPPADAKPAPTAAADVSGQWCGKQVSDAASCKGDDVMFADLKMSGDAVTGELCEAYKKDCMALDASTFKSNTLAFGYKFKQGTGTGTFQLGADGVLTGELKVTKGKKEATVPKKLYRVK